MRDGDARAGSSEACQRPISPWVQQFDRAGSAGTNLLWFFVSRRSAFSELATHVVAARSAPGAAPEVMSLQVAAHTPWALGQDQFAPLFRAHSAFRVALDRTCLRSFKADRASGFAL